ncbi:MAG: 2-dehydropantoate 2-reductase [Dehalococcoidia bacterium]|nr:2-dehydropantoate 2-reductase [Dehalococcoidia bacterium]
MGERLRIAVIGAGAVGCYYGGRLAQAGHDVRFLMRRDHDAVQRDGLTVYSPKGDFRIEKPFVARTSAEIGEVDWVICALKGTSLDEAEALIRPCAGPKTKILAIMNGLGVEERFAGWFGGERVFGGLAFTCLNRGEPGIVHHLGYGAVTLAHYQDDAAQLEEAARVWQGSVVDISTAPSLLKARWEKLCWNIPFNGMTVAAGGVTTDALLADEPLLETARALMSEVVAIGNADLKAHGEPGRIDGEETVTRMFRLTATMGAYQPSTLIDFLEGRALEVETIFGEPLRRARSLGVESPRLEALTSALREVDRRLERADRA